MKFLVGWLFAKFYGVSVRMEDDGPHVIYSARAERRLRPEARERLDRLARDERQRRVAGLN